MWSSICVLMGQIFGEQIPWLPVLFVIIGWTTSLIWFIIHLYRKEPLLEPLYAKLRIAFDPLLQAINFVQNPQTNEVPMENAAQPLGFAKATTAYTSPVNYEVSFVAGEEFTILDDSDENWWILEKRNGKRGLAPVKLLSKIPRFSKR